MGYGDLVLDNIIISKVSYVQGLGHNLFSLGKFYDKGLEIILKAQTCTVYTPDGKTLLVGIHKSNLYTFDTSKIKVGNDFCLLTKSTSDQAWLWHKRLSHLNFDSIGVLASRGLVKGLPKIRYLKDHLCLACEQGKMKRASHKPKSESQTKRTLELLHMDLCGPMRIQSRNGKKYVLVMVDDFSRYTWVKFLQSKDETPTTIIDFIKSVQVSLDTKVQILRSDNGTEFKNYVLESFLKSAGISHQFSAARTPQQNGVVERRNRTLVEAAK